MGFILAIIWGGVGAVYHGMYISKINPIARIFAVGFLAQALLFAAHALIGRGLEFNTRSRLRVSAGVLMIS